MTAKHAILVAVLALAVSSESRAQDQDASAKAAVAAAQAGLAAFAELVTSANYRQMGFERPEDVRKATLGVPVGDFFVRLDELQRYQPGANPSALLRSGLEFVFPVLVQGAVRSSLTVSRVKSDWRATSFGAPSLMRLLEGVRAAKSKETAQPPSSFFVVRVPALKLQFLGHNEGGALMLTPIVDDARFGFKAGASIPAEKALEQLLPAAKRHDGSPS